MKEIMNGIQCRKDNVRNVADVITHEQRHNMVNKGV